MTATRDPLCDVPRNFMHNLIPTLAVFEGKFLLLFIVLFFEEFFMRKSLRGDFYGTTSILVQFLTRAFME
jgi:hypothetical protein